MATARRNTIRRSNFVAVLEEPEVAEAAALALPAQALPERTGARAESEPLEQPSLASTRSMLCTHPGRFHDNMQKYISRRRASSAPGGGILEADHGSDSDDDISRARKQKEKGRRQAARRRRRGDDQGFEAGAQLRGLAERRGPRR